MNKQYVKGVQKWKKKAYLRLDSKMITARLPLCFSSEARDNTYAVQRIEVKEEKGFQELLCDYSLATKWICPSSKGDNLLSPNSCILLMIWSIDYQIQYHVCNKESYTEQCFSNCTNKMSVIHKRKFIWNI